MMKTNEITLEKPLFKANAENDKKAEIVFVCTGNTCRSPMAEAFYNAFWANAENIASSAGLSSRCEPISANAEYVITEMGIKKYPPFSRPFTAEIGNKAYKIIGITRTHCENLILSYPEFASKITCLPVDIPDPYGGDVFLYKKTAKDILCALKLMFGEPLRKYEDN